MFHGGVVEQLVQLHLAVFGMTVPMLKLGRLPSPRRAEAASPLKVSSEAAQTMVPPRQLLLA